MIILKTEREMDLMHESGKIAYGAMEKVAAAVRPGVTTKELDRIAENEILKFKALPSFKGYGGFPAAACVSVNEEVVHGIPSERRLNEGDIVSIDLGALYHGYHSDMARTFPVGKISAEHAKLIEVTKECFFKALFFAVPGNRIGDISAAVEEYAESFGYGVVRDLVGHGVGQELHEDPSIPNFTGRTRGPSIRPGMTLAIEPMINLGTWQVKFNKKNGWTVTAADGKYSAHYENTVGITDGEPVILTMP